jgi:hypothetical protein
MSTTSHFPLVWVLISCFVFVSIEVKNHFNAADVDTHIKKGFVLDSP